MLKGSIVVKKAYCDWERYKEFKSVMHEAAFELIEIPHVRQSGKNSADIRMVVDALDLCYTKSHVDTFVVISGDSDFSPLRSASFGKTTSSYRRGGEELKLRFVNRDCDEFIYYDDLVRKKKKARNLLANPVPKEPKSAVTETAKKEQALDLVMETLEALAEERGAGDLIWGSMGNRPSSAGGRI